MTPEDPLRGGRDASGETRLAEMVMREMGAFRKEMRESLTNLVSREAFQAEKERVNERMGDMREDLEHERRAREQAVKGEADARAEAVAKEQKAREEAMKAEEAKRVAIEAEQDKARNGRRWLIGVALIPLAFMLMQYILANLATGA